MTTGKLDAVLPLRRRDHARFTILDRSLRRNFRDLGCCWVVTTDAEHAELAALIDDGPYRVIPESELIPEIDFYRRIYRFISLSAWLTRLRGGRLDVTGWYVQQLVKLAIAERIETDFYLTLDADVICVRPVTRGDLIREGRALANLRARDAHPAWYADAERVLGVGRPGPTHGVTPSLLGRDAVRQLHAFLADRVAPFARRLGAIFPRGSHARNLCRSWRSLLLRNTPWTEYTLYHTFLEHAEIFDRYHLRGDDDAIYDTGASVWHAREFDDVDIEAVFEGAAFFLVIQSNTGISPDVVWKKVAAWLD